MQGEKQLEEAESIYKYLKENTHVYINPIPAPLLVSSNPSSRSSQFWISPLDYGHNLMC